jgi:hypothetical protein
MNTFFTSCSENLKWGGLREESLLRSRLVAASMLVLSGALCGQAAFGPIYWLQQGNASAVPNYNCSGITTLSISANVGSLKSDAAIFWTGCHLEPNHPAPPPNTSSATQVYIRYFKGGATTLLSVNANGLAGNGSSTVCSFSRNGLFATFLTEATDIVSPDINNRQDIIWTDVVTGLRERVSDGMLGQQGNGDCYASFCDNSGRFVVFGSDSSNLVPNDSNVMRDVFMRDRLLGTTTLVSAASGGGSANGFSAPVASTPDGEYVV